MKKHIYLIGYMGTGKTTVGNLLSSKLSLPLLEMDEILTDRFSMSISEIFDAFGEDAFRSAEEDLLEEISTMENPSIVSCGGGVILSDNNRRILRESGTTVLLQADPMEIFKRLQNNNTRPLLSGGNKLEKISKIYEERLPLYKEAAEIIIDTDNKTPEEIVAYQPRFISETNIKSQISTDRFNGINSVIKTVQTFAEKEMQS